MPHFLDFIDLWSRTLNLRIVTITSFELKTSFWMVFESLLCFVMVEVAQTFLRCKSSTLRPNHIGFCRSLKHWCTWFHNLLQLSYGLSTESDTCFLILELADSFLWQPFCTLLQSSINLFRRRKFYVVPSIVWFRWGLRVNWNSLSLSL